MLLQYETNRLIMKVIKPEDAAQVLDFYLRDRELFEQFEPERVADFYTLEKQKQMVTLEYNAAVKGRMFRYYIYRRECQEQIIGTICFHDITYGCISKCDIGYKFSSKYHHMGYATEALSMIVQLIFTDLHIHRIMAWVLPDNEPSARLLGRVGFSYEGISRDYLYLQGRWRDHAQYSLLYSDVIHDRYGEPRI